MSLFMSAYGFLNVISNIISSWEQVNFETSIYKLSENHYFTRTGAAGAGRTHNVIHASKAMAKMKYE